MACDRQGSSAHSPHREFNTRHPMHPNTLPQDIVDRLMVRRGSLHLFDSIAPEKTALVVIDMQNAFLQPGAPSETPAAREIVPNINRLARALRARGGTVAFAQASFQPEGPDAWPLFFDHMVNPRYSAAILEALTPGRPGHALWPALSHCRQPGARACRHRAGLCQGVVVQD